LEKGNDKISSFQFGIMAFFLTGGLFVGMGIISIFSIDSYNAWIATFISFVICIIPFLFLKYIINYQPDKNIFEKNKLLFGKWIGFVINLLFVVYVFFMVILVLWSTTSFAITMYLTKTPEYFIASVFVGAAIYTVIKGIETIGRVGEILFYMTLIIIVITITSLTPQFDFNFLKPIMKNGISPVIMQSLHFTSYLFTPLIFLLIIPKNNIVNNKACTKYLIGGITLGILLMLTVFILVPGVITPELSSMYRFPAYYIQRKINIGGVINNLENFLSLHWYFNTYILMVIGLFVLDKYIEDLFKIKKQKTKTISIIIIGIILIIARGYIFNDTTIAIDFMENKFPFFVSILLFILIFITCILIFIKRRIRKA
jgi:spore germination protein KB